MNNFEPPVMLSEHMIEKRPKHLAFICDGNGRWAQERGLSRNKGHIAGLFHTLKVVDICIERRIPIISAFLWSTENWNRPRFEVRGIMRAAVKYVPDFAMKMHERQAKLLHCGIRKNVPRDVLEVIDDAVALTENNTETILNMCFNYGGKSDIIQAVNKLVREVSDPEEITPESLGNYLLTGTLPDVDLLIRTGREKRLSNFMIWQCAYAELYAADCYWPDLTESDIDAALKRYNLSLRK